MTTTTTNPFDAANDVLMGGAGGAPAARFQNPGDTVSGTITSVSVYQEREFNRATKRSDGGPKFFPSGDPIMGVAVTLATTLRDPNIEDDDGSRRIYVQGKRLKNAIREAIAAAGAHGLDNGATLTVTFTGVEGEMDAKCYAASYVPAAHVAANAAVMGAPAQPVQQVAPQPVQQVAPQPVQQVAPQPVQQVAPAAPVPAAPAQPSPEQVAALRAANIDPASVFPGFVG